MGALAELEHDMACVDVAGCDAFELRDLTRRVYRAERTVEGWKRRIAAAAKALEDTGSGPAAAATLGTPGGLPGRRAKELADQAGLLAPLPAVSAAAQSGWAHPDNIDAVARTLRGLTTAERDALARADAALGRAVCDTAPELFAYELRNRVRSIRDAAAGDAESDIERRRRRSGLRFGPSRDQPGMRWLSGILRRRTQRRDRRPPRHRSPTVGR